MKKPQAKKPASKPKPEPSMAAVAAAPANRPPPTAEERRFRAEDAMRTLQRAEEIKGDKGLMADVKAHAQKQVAVISKIAGGGKKPNAPDRPTRKPKAKPA